MSGRCKDCRFWEQWWGDEEEPDYLGLCRIHPPRISRAVEVDGIEDFGVWPTTHGSSWCGAHQPREAADGDDR